MESLPWAATEAAAVLETATLLPALLLLLLGSETTVFFVSFFGLVTGFTSLTALPLVFNAGLAAAFDAVLPAADFAGALIDLDWVFGAGFAVAFVELLDAFLAAGFVPAVAAFFALAVNAVFFAATLFLAEVTTVFITSLPELPNALFNAGTALVLLRFY